MRINGKKILPVSFWRRFKLIENNGLGYFWLVLGDWWRFNCAEYLNASPNSLSIKLNRLLA